ncbi:S1 family peptidase [Kamptonema formosum]|uniref:S1 family peptidase n=1 Tax=Kamptonema formosum TaxID=331992 RepID=UPI00035E1DBB|nr:serine protease [Oscillatoria sp. PCC 10802]
MPNFATKLRPLILALLLGGIAAGFPLQTPTPAVFSQPERVQVAEIARRVTVRILYDSGAGSGVIVKREGGTYTVLTNRHVVAGSQENGYTIITEDGAAHAGKWLRDVGRVFGEVDLALVEFKSGESYGVAVLGEWGKLSVGDAVYAAGFPNWQLKNGSEIENTREWGVVRAFRVTGGKVGMLPAEPLVEGYQLGYTNDIAQGMSGGPVLDGEGKLVGINGRSKYPLAGIDAFKFAGGGVPVDEVFLEMEALSWAIPISYLGNLAHPRQSVGAGSPELFGTKRRM